MNQGSRNNQIGTTNNTGRQDPLKLVNVYANV